MSHEGSKAWGWRHAMCAAKELPATTKHVLLTLSMFMNEFGESCFPPISDLVKYSSLDKKTVIKHLGIAREKGWVAVSQHGFRGQKWKRNEYSVRWPERDLVAPSEPLETDEGGGSPPPPSGKKVVDLVPEGGGAGSQKVVEEVHQDKNSPDNLPITSSIERERARERDPEPCPKSGHGKPAKPPDPGTSAAGPSPKSGHGRSAKQIDRLFWTLVKDWPQQKGMPKGNAQSAFEQLSEEEQDQALENRDVWIALLKSQGKDHFPAPSTYCRERLWKEIPEDFGKTALQGETSVAPPFGKAWGAARFACLVMEPTGSPPKLTTAQEQMIDQGLYSRDDLLREKRAMNGWPRVNTMHERAIRRRLGVACDPALAGLADLFGKVHRDSPAWIAWRDLHAKKGWPWFGPDRDCPEWVWMPAPPDAPETYANPFAEVRAALARFEAEHANLTQRQAAE